MGFLRSLIGKRDAVNNEIKEYEGTNILLISELLVNQFTDNKRYIQLAKDELNVPDNLLKWFVADFMIFTINASMEAARQEIGNNNYQILLKLFLATSYIHFKKHYGKSSAREMIENFTEVSSKYWECAEGKNFLDDPEFEKRNTIERMSYLFTSRHVERPFQNNKLFETILGFSYKEWYRVYKPSKSLFSAYKDNLFDSHNDKVDSEIISKFYSQLTQ